jgi:hypothetical protein
VTAGLVVLSRLSALLFICNIAAQSEGICRRFGFVIPRKLQLWLHVGMTARPIKAPCGQTQNVALVNWEQDRAKHGGFGKDPVVP